MKRPRIQHVSIPRPPGSHEQTRAFYGELLGLEEKIVPGTIEHLDLIWYNIGENMELHCFTEEPREDTSGRHFCMDVEDVAAMREIMSAAGRAVTGGLDIRIDVEIVRWPDRYMDERGEAMWDRVISLLGAVQKAPKR